MLPEKKDAPWSDTPESIPGRASADALAYPEIRLYGDYTRAFSELQEEVEEKFSPKKAGTIQLAKIYYHLGEYRRAYNLSNCGSLLDYRVTELGKRLQSANFCRDRLCPMCNWRRSLKLFSNLSRILEVLQPRGYQFVSLTLTIRNVDSVNLPSAVDKLFAGWRYLYNKNRVFRSAVQGTFRTFECTRNPVTGQFHPHLHCLLAVWPDYFYGRNYIAQKGWRDLWAKAMHLDYDPSVEVHKVVPRARAGQDEQTMLGAVCEVTKYAVKGSDYLSGPMDEQLTSVATYLRALTGRRLISMTGVFREVNRDLNLEDAEEGDLVHVSDEDDISDAVCDLMVRYHWNCGVYVFGSPDD